MWNIYLLGNNLKKIQSSLEKYTHIRVKESFQLGNFDYQAFEGKITPDEFFIIDETDANKELSVFTGLFLRNIGGQVFITCHLDTKDLIEVIGDVYKAISEDPNLRTEIIVTQTSQHHLGDITPIVKRFEQENL